MEQFINSLLALNDPTKIFYLCGIFIFADVITGYLKAFKQKKVNSSISRDGYIKKISWVVAIVLGYFVDYFVSVNIFLVGSALVCITTEGMSVYENLGEVGVNLPFSKYFEAIDEKK